ncbi:MAG: phage tail assembly protein [Loktanella sp.]|nr:phage tail assembly protein [Loktanella sp.]
MAERITLAHPFEIGGETVETVSLRRPKVKDLRAIDEAGDGDEFKQAITMIAVLSDMTPEMVDEIDTEDFTMLSDRVRDFFPKAGGSETGDK